MGGKAAEFLYYGNNFISVGAIQDLKQANNLAELMIGNYGMGEELEAFYNKNIDPMLARTGDVYSENTKQIIDKESIYLVSEALDTAKQILEKNREKLDILIGNLINKTTLYSDDFEILSESSDDEDCECSLIN